jgi:UDP-N-acetylglucosamine 1-carboxyvinyltransferase
MARTGPSCPDRIETGTYAIAAAAAGGEVVLKDARAEHNHALWRALRLAGVEVEEGETASPSGAPARSSRWISRPNPFPGFATDLQAQFMALMTLADGASIIRETIFENRFMHVPELNRLGADIQVRGNEAVVRGPSKLERRSGDGDGFARFGQPGDRWPGG